MTNKDIKYIESDIPCMLSTQATILDLLLQDVNPEKIKGMNRKVIRGIFNTLMYLHKNYKLVKK